MSFENWTEGLPDVCSGFQVSLSCLVDGELDETAASRAMVHLESCPCCRDFLDDTRRQVQLHRDIADPDRLLARVAMLTGEDLTSEVRQIDLQHRLATIFYQLGKAYTLLGIDPDGFRERVFEAPVPVDSTKHRGRGFVDAVLMDESADDAAVTRSAGGVPESVDWTRARHMLNGQLEKIEEPLAKGRRLLEEALTVESDHEEARHYIALVHQHEGRAVRAAEEFRALFDTAVDERNRVHAAINLGRMYYAEGETRKALQFWRWTLMFGNADADERFWCVRYNIALAHIKNLDAEQALAALRGLLDRYSDHASEIAQAMSSASQEMRDSISRMNGFSEALMKECPELFVAAAEQKGGA